ncbi:hypothetical protein [Rhizobium sp. Leaf341]|uniref:hypothetical protein n=1 Tax=Rhizobium sp. Leaf341 TaxID=1736344 RepID=UPI0007158F8D|nr:hypothetical protein [Rhizobium sp. Leaf341]KQR75975.1 hypothetical protein ASG03_20255 [Rhizobium sp. Leaf341]
MKGISLKVRLSKKRLLGAAACLVVIGGGAAYVLKSGLLSDAVDEATSSQPSGVACTTTDFIKLNRGGQRWLRKYVRTDSVDGIERVRTALRVAGVLAKAEKADLYQVVVLDRAGPEGRANLRGAAIGAEVLFAPDPTKLPDMAQPFIARYVDGRANPVGLFYGERKTLSPDDIRAALTEMTDRTDCETLVADSAAPVEGDTVGAHGKPAAHGQSAGESAGQGAGEGHGEPVEGHGAAADAHGEAAEGHEAPAASGHDAPDGEHADGKPADGEPADGELAGQPEPQTQGGWVSTITAWIPGMGGKAEAVHGAPQEAPGQAQPGMLSTVLQLIPGMGPAATADTAATSDHGTADHETPEQAVTVPETGHEAAHTEAAAGSPGGEDAAHGTPAASQDMSSPTPRGPDTQEAAGPHAVTPEETGATH